MGANVSRNSFDYKEIEKISVIAGFDENGNIIPIYVKIHGEKYKVDEYREKSKFSGITEYQCKLKGNSGEMPLLISYYSEESLWVTPRR